MTAKDTIEKHIADNSLNYDQVAALTIPEWISIIGERVSHTRMENILRTIVSKIRLDYELAEVERIRVDFCQDLENELKLKYPGYSWEFDSQSKDVIIHTQPISNDTPEVPE